MDGWMHGRWDLSEDICIHPHPHTSIILFSHWLVIDQTCNTTSSHDMKEVTPVSVHKSHHIHQSVSGHHRHTDK